MPLLRTLSAADPGGRSTAADPGGRSTAAVHYLQRQTIGDASSHRSDFNRPINRPIFHNHRDFLNSRKHFQDFADCAPAPPPLKRRRSDDGWNAAAILGFSEQPRVRYPDQRSVAGLEDGDALVSRDEIERCSPSRKDGIDCVVERQLRSSYCSFIHGMGIQLQLPHSTVATAVVLCHRFFFRRSHACNDRYLVATAALFLAAKSEETPCLLNSVIRASCQVSQDLGLPYYPYLLHAQDWFSAYREQVTATEQMILTTLDFELEVKHPYAPLTSVLNKLGLSETALVGVAWNLISEGLRSSLWLQFKPHHIAAGAAFLAAKFLNYDLAYHPSFWQAFNASLPIVQDVVQQLMELVS